MLMVLMDDLFVSQRYAQMTEDFISDDHDHDVSVSSLSVQIFTVPSLVGLLVKKCGTMTTLFLTTPAKGGFSLAAKPGRSPQIVFFSFLFLLLNS